MTVRASWREVTVHPREVRGSDWAPSYAPKDRSFLLLNDLAAGSSVLVRSESPQALDKVTTTWLADLGPTRPHPLGPHDSVDGYGVFTFPYGPVSMGVPEAGRFDVRTYGERVLGLTPYGGFKSRRITESVVGLTVNDAALRIERMAGPVSASHVSAFLGAAESATGLEVPFLEMWVRALAQELQRVYNHIRQIARVAEAASQNVGLAQLQALAEQILRLQGDLFGHRWLFGALLPGGPARRLDRGDRRRATEQLARQVAEFEELWALLLESRTFIDRIQTTCAVPRDHAVRWGAVGPTLRASGVAWDDRLRAPVAPYGDLFVPLHLEKEGDALARILVRAEEVRGSFLLLEQLLNRWPSAGDAPVPAAPAVAEGRGLARVEAPSGDLVYDVRIAEGRLVELGFRSPSQANWPIFASGLRDGVFTDFHFAFESFGLLFAETDG